VQNYVNDIVKLMDKPIIARGLSALVALVVVLLMAHAVRRVITRRVENNEARYRARKFATATGWVVLVLVWGGIFSDKLGGIALSLGVVGAGVAFALQEVIASMAGRVAVMFASFYETGDRVQLGGIKGDVIDIGLLRTTIMEVGDWVDGDLFTGRVVRVANSFVFKEPVYNYSGDFEFLWDEITVPIKYGCDHREAKRVLERIVHEATDDYAASANVEWQQMLAKYRVEPARVEPMVTLFCNDNWMEFTVRYVVPYTRRRITKDLLFVKLMDAVNASDDKLALASATFHLVEAPPIDVRLQRGPQA
jgi:small-conductance mechanosensitive channel